MFPIVPSSSHGYFIHVYSCYESSLLLPLLYKTQGANNTASDATEIRGGGLGHGGETDKEDHKENIHHNCHFSLCVWNIHRQSNNLPMADLFALTLLGLYFIKSLDQDGMST